MYLKVDIPEVQEYLDHFLAKDLKSGHFFKISHEIDQLEVGICIYGKIPTSVKRGLGRSTSKLVENSIYCKWVIRDINYKRQSIGRRLMIQLFSLAYHEGVSIFLFAKTVKRRKYFEKLGFTVVGDRFIDGYYPMLVTLETISVVLGVE